MEIYERQLLLTRHLYTIARELDLRFKRAGYNSVKNIEMIQENEVILTVNESEHIAENLLSTYNLSIKEITENYIRVIIASHKKPKVEIKYI